ncbi:hypothetical protein RKD47_000020 [Streptomyces albogriseolus]
MLGIEGLHNRMTGKQAGQPACIRSFDGKPSGVEGGGGVASGLREVNVDIPRKGQRVLRLIGLEGDATQQADPVERDTLTREDEDECEEGGPGIAVVERVKETHVR